MIKKGKKLSHKNSFTEKKNFKTKKLLKTKNSCLKKVVKEKNI